MALLARTRARVRAFEQRMSLRMSGGIVVLSSLLAFASVLGFLAYADLAREQERARQDVVVQVRALAARIETHLTEHLRGVSAAATLVAASRGSGDAIERQLRVLRRIFGDLRRVWVVDASGAVLAVVVPDRATRGRDGDGLRRWATGTRPLVGEPRQAGAEIVVDLYAPTRAPGGEVSGGIGAELVLQRILDLLAEVGRESGSVAEILTPEGVVGAGRPPILMRGVRPGYPDLLGRDWVGERVFEDGVRRFTVAAAIQPADWTLVVAHPLGRVRPGAWRFSLQLAITAGAAALLGAAAAWLLLRRTLAGLEQLRAAMSQLGSGSLPSSLAIEPGGEVGALADGFNRMLDRLKSRFGEHRALARVDQAASVAILTGRSRDVVLSDLLRTVVAAMGADVGVILFPESDGLRVKVAVGLWGVRPEGLVVRGGRGLANAAMASRRVEAVPDTDSDHRADEPYVRLAGLRSLFAAPMVSRGRVIGVLEVGSRLPRLATGADSRQLGAMVQRVVQALEDARSLEAWTTRPTGFLAIVRRGATTLFETLKRHLERPGFVEVIWDRRVGPRRVREEPVGRERRKGDRRQESPLASSGRDYILVRRSPDKD
jgi:GAF domain-containing protein